MLSNVIARTIMAEFFVETYNRQICKPKISYGKKSVVMMMKIKESINIKEEKEKRSLMMMT